MQPKSKDKQLEGISLEEVLQKKSLDQALNAKEFAICAGVSYSIARKWFRLPDFPCIQGVVFWRDFVKWREKKRAPETSPRSQQTTIYPSAEMLPPRVLQILRDV